MIPCLLSPTVQADAKIHDDSFTLYQCEFSSCGKKDFSLGQLLGRISCRNSFLAAFGLTARRTDCRAHSGIFPRNKGIIFERMIKTIKKKMLPMAGSLNPEMKVHKQAPAGLVPVPNTPRNHKEFQILTQRVSLWEKV